MVAINLDGARTTRSAEADKAETPQDRDEWVAQEVKKLLLQIAEDTWSEVWAVISPQGGSAV